VTHRVQFLISSPYLVPFQRYSEILVENRRV